MLEHTPGKRIELNQLFVTNLDIIHEWKVEMKFLLQQQISIIFDMKVLHCYTVYSKYQLKKKKIYQVVARLGIGISATPIESKVFEAQTKYGMCCVLIIRFNLVCENIRIFTFSLRHVHMCVQLAKICTWTFSQQLKMIYLSFRVHLLFSPHFRSIAVSFSPMPTDIDVFV